MPDIDGQTAREFWDRLYGQGPAETSGTPSHVLERLVADRTPGRALDLGCAKGDDVVWLARRGWRALGVDISAEAVRLARRNAARQGQTGRARFAVCDLSRKVPRGPFDLVTGIFLQTPFDFPRRWVMAQAARAVRSGGLLLMVTHQKVAPWSWGDPEAALPDAEARLEEMGLDLTGWRRLRVGPVTRRATGPGGATANVVDAVVALERH